MRKTCLQKYQTSLSARYLLELKSCFLSAYSRQFILTDAYNFFGLAQGYTLPAPLCCYPYKLEYSYHPV